jgi:lipopolysaccharide transport system ATP-binding protein
MSDVVLKIDKLSKLYRMGATGTGSLRQDIKRWWIQNVRKKEDAFFKLAGADQIDSSYFWALKDIDFEIRQGEVWGVVGANGAGKSTLLKIISRIIKPTHGRVNGKGRISSLLEVGTGFHQELSGRENIFLSGYLLGMNKQEINRDFDAIVAFSGIEPFIDTPVKRYSSGMYVRLAFAVAAHLEPDILIVDEVLAVGDAEFQKKCLGKMHEVSVQKGRTILFVSHNMQAVKQLCTKAVWLQKGHQAAIGDVHSVASRYISTIQKNVLSQSWEQDQHAPGNEWVRINKVELIPQLHESGAAVDIRTPFIFRISFTNVKDGVQLSLGLHLFSYEGECIFDVTTSATVFNQGVINGECRIPGDFLNDGSYFLSVIFMKDTSIPLFYLEECISFEVSDYRENMQWFGKWMGAVRPKFPFSIEQSK